MNVADLVTPAPRETTREMRLVLDAHGTLQPYELTFVRQDGHESVLEVSAWFLYEDGSPVEVQGIGRDVTERKRIEAVARDAEANLRAVLEHAPDLILRLDRQGRVIYSSGAQSMIGKLAADPSALVDQIEALLPRVGAALREWAQAA